MSETATRFSEAEKVILFAWLQENPQVVKTRANAARIGDYLEARNLKATIGNLDKALVALKAAGQLEIYKTPQEAEEEKIEKVRQVIYADVAQKIAPAQLNFADPATIGPLAAWLHKNKGGRMSADSLMEAIHALKFKLPWVVEPAGLEKARRIESLGYDDSRTEHGVQGRRNHAEDTIDVAATEKAKREKKVLEDEESRTIGELWTREIDSYLAVENGRINRQRTEAIQNLLRKWMSKRGNVLQAIRSMPDEPAAAEAWLRRGL